MKTNMDTKRFKLIDVRTYRDIPDRCDLTWEQACRLTYSYPQYSVGVVRDDAATEWQEQQAAAELDR